MSREIAYLARLKANATKEIAATAVDVFGDATKFTSQLTENYTRKRLLAYNNSNSNSGEVVWGNSTVTGDTGMIIPKGLAPVDIPVQTDVDLYFINSVSGELCNLRVVEIA